MRRPVPVCMGCNWKGIHETGTAWLPLNDLNVSRSGMLECTGNSPVQWEGRRMEIKVGCPGSGLLGKHRWAMTSLFQGHLAPPRWKASDLCPPAPLQHLRATQEPPKYLLVTMLFHFPFFIYFCAQMSAVPLSNIWMLLLQSHLPACSSPCSPRTHSLITIKVTCLLKNEMPFSDHPSCSITNRILRGATHADMKC